MKPGHRIQAKPRARHTAFMGHRAGTAPAADRAAVLAVTGFADGSAGPIRLQPGSTSNVQPDRVNLLTPSGSEPGSPRDQVRGQLGWRWCSELFIEGAASERWRYVNSPHLVALVQAGAKCEKGVLIERPDEAKTEVAA